MKLSSFIFSFFLFCSLLVTAQKSLEITAVRLGQVKIYELYINEMMEYKLKGDFFYKKKSIADLKDTIIFFQDETTITFGDLKAIRVRKQQHLFRTFHAFFLGCGVGFFSLSAFNNLLLKNPPVFRENVAYISAGLVLTSFLIYELGVRHLHINKHKTIRIVERNYDNLNSK